MEAPINSENNTVNETTAKVAQRNEVNYCYTLCGGIASLYIYLPFLHICPDFIPLANLNTGEYNYYTGSCCKIGEWLIHHSIFIVLLPHISVFTFLFIIINTSSKFPTMHSFWMDNIVKVYPLCNLFIYFILSLQYKYMKHIYIFPI